MARKKSRQRKKRDNSIQLQKFFGISALCVAVFVVSSFSYYHFVLAANSAEPIALRLDPNIGLEAYVTEFFTANDATEMIPIIKCESEFKHFDKDGASLKNHAGSSATGIAQILASAHPDPKVLEVFNKRHNSDLTVADFDITTVEGNLGYALALYQVRGVRDWECSKKFRFR